MVVWLAAWPGYYTYDAGYFTSYLNDKHLLDRQSPIHTIFVGSIMRVGLGIFVDFNSAVAFYIAFQLLICLALIGYILNFMLKMKCPRLIFIFSVLFLALSPSISMFAMCTTKDIMCSVIIVTFCLNGYQLINNKQTGRTSKLRIFGCVVLTFLIAVYRNNCLYALFLIIPAFCLLLSKTKRKKVILIFASCILGLGLGFVWKGPVYDLLDVEHDNLKGEMISVPSMQLARAAAYDVSLGFACNNFEKAGVDAPSVAKTYNAQMDNSDSMRFRFFISKADFISLYVAELKDNPHAYVVAPLILTQAAWSPFAYSHGYNYNSEYISNYSFLYPETESSVFAAWVESPANADSKIQWLSDALWHYSRDNPFTTYPLFSWTCSVSFFMWLLLLVLVRCINKKNYGGMFFCIALLCIAITNLLGPLILIRYYWYLFLSAPFLLFLLFSKQPNEQPDGRNTQAQARLLKTPLATTQTSKKRFI